MSKEDKNKTETKSDNKVDEIVTINDFKSMLVGMDLILGDEWTPDENQWKRIRAKIDALIVTHDQPRTGRSTVPSYGPANSNLNVSENELLRSFPNVPVDNSVPIGEAGPSSPSALVPQVAPTDNTAVKTPDIDSRAGYKSTFV